MLQSQKEHKPQGYYSPISQQKTAFWPTCNREGHPHRAPGAWLSDMVPFHTLHSWGRHAETHLQESVWMVFNTPLLGL